jgi:hypothetical protein
LACRYGRVGTGRRHWQELLDERLRADPSLGRWPVFHSEAVQFAGFACGLLPAWPAALVLGCHHYSLGQRTYLASPSPSSLHGEHPIRSVAVDPVLDSCANGLCDLLAPGFPDAFRGERDALCAVLQTNWQPPSNPSLGPSNRGGAASLLYETISGTNASTTRANSSHFTRVQFIVLQSGRGYVCIRLNRHRQHRLTSAAYRWDVYQRRFRAALVGV